MIFLKIFFSYMVFVNQCDWSLQSPKVNCFYWWISGSDFLLILLFSTPPIDSFLVMTQINIVIISFVIWKHELWFCGKLFGWENIYLAMVYNSILKTFKIELRESSCLGSINNFTLHTPFLAVGSTSSADPFDKFST